MMRSVETGARTGAERLEDVVVVVLVHGQHQAE
jgi:hypothetical protein